MPGSQANWSSPDSSPWIAVGSCPEGQGRWGHDDLAGGMNEWVLDMYDHPGSYEGAGNPCDDCADVAAGSERTFRGGGFRNLAPELRAGNREKQSPDERKDFIGFRCARRAP